MHNSQYKPKQKVGRLGIPIISGVYFVDNSADITNHSSVTTKGSLANIVAAIGSNVESMEVPSGNYNLGTGTVVVPANISLKIHKGAVFSNGTLTVNGSLDVDVYPIGTATLNGVYNYHNIPQVKDLVELKKLTGNPNQSISLLGSASIGDGLGGLFYWSAASTATVDDVNVVAATGVTIGRWLRNYTQVSDGAFDGAPLKVGAYFLWVDAVGDLRIKATTPTSDTDGDVVGMQTTA